MPLGINNILICFGNAKSTQNNYYIYTFPVAYTGYYSVCVTPGSGYECAAFSNR